MNKFQKALYKFLENPTSLHFSQIHKILIKLNFKKINAKGSHLKYKHPELNHDLIIPIHQNDCKPFYKKEIAKILLTLIQ